MLHIVHPDMPVNANPVKLMSNPAFVAMNNMASEAINAANMPPVMRHVTE